MPATGWPVTESVTVTGMRGRSVRVSPMWSAIMIEVNSCPVIMTADMSIRAVGLSLLTWAGPASRWTDQGPAHELPSSAPAISK